MLQAHEFNGWLKQVNSYDLNSVQSLALKLIFPHLVPPDKESVDRNVKKIKEEDPTTHVLPMYVNDRRFAGDFTLTPQRYFTVAHGANGNDYGTLSSELGAYFDNNNSSIEVHDFVTKEIAAQEGVAYQAQSILIKINGTPGSNSLIARLGTNLIWIPYRVKQVVIPNVVDLRLPDVQEWFWKEFKDINAYVTNELRKNMREGVGPSEIKLQSFITPSSFFDMLPTLMDPKLGGNRVTDHIGQRLRLAKFSALIYPSARIHAGVIWENGEMKRFPGWNLVDYRGLNYQFEIGLIIFFGAQPWTSEYAKHFDLRKIDDKSWIMFPAGKGWKYPQKPVSDEDLKIRYAAGFNVFEKLIYLTYGISESQNLTWFDAMLMACKTGEGHTILNYMGITLFYEFTGRNDAAFKRVILFECSCIFNGKSKISKGFAFIEEPPASALSSLDIEPENYITGIPVFSRIDEGMYLYYLREQVNSKSRRSKQKIL